MPVFYEWVDFIIYPLDNERIKSAAERLDVTGALLPTSPEWTPSSGIPALITKKHILPFFDNDTFEAMEISDYGHVMIWTQKRVWYLQRENDVIEKLRYQHRHPPKPK